MKRTECISLLTPGNLVSNGTLQWIPDCTCADLTNLWMTAGCSADLGLSGKFQTDHLWDDQSCNVSQVNNLLSLSMLQNAGFDLEAVLH